MKSGVNIKKANGEMELFDIIKLEYSLKRAGASELITDEITKKIEKDLVEGMTTHEIYKKAFSHLHKKEKIAAAKYSVRRAILDLGPHGFPFEDFVGEIYRVKGYQVEVGKTISGFCVMHELDVVAENETEFIAAELKFHNNTGVKSDLKTVLYVKARFEDLEKGDFYKTIDSKKTKKGFLITNTKFSSRAIQYGNCAGLNMIGWNYPSKGNLQDLIEETKLHPLTCLSTLSKKEKQEFLNQGIVLCRDITGGGEVILKTVGIQGKKAKEVLEEAHNVCK